MGASPLYSSIDDEYTKVMATLTEFGKEKKTLSTVLVFETTDLRHNMNVHSTVRSQTDW